MDLPKPKNKKPVSLEIETALLKEVKDRAKKLNIKFTDVVEYSLKKFLEETK